MGKILRRIRRAKLAEKRQQEAQTTAPTQEQSNTQAQEAVETTTQETPWEETLADALEQTARDTVIETPTKTVAKVHSSSKQPKSRKLRSNKTTTKTSEQ
jgi:hypothetical protein